MKKIRISIFLFFFPLSCAFSQENDFQFWTSFSVNDKFISKTDIYFKYGIRFRENASLISDDFIEMKLKYRFSKKFSVSLGVRDINEWNQKMQIKNKNRYFADLLLRKKNKRFMFSLRNRFQQQESETEYAYTFRQKGVVSYNIRKTKLEPLFAIECFYNKSKINKLRYTISFSYPLYQDLDLNLSYRIQNQLYDLATIFIFDTKLSYNF